MRQDFKKSGAKDLKISVQIAKTNKQRRLLAKNIVSIAEGKNEQAIIVYRQTKTGSLEELQLMDSANAIVDILNGKLSDERVREIKSEVIKDRYYQTPKDMKDLDEITTSMLNSQSFSFLAAEAIAFNNSRMEKIQDRLFRDKSAWYNLKGIFGRKATHTVTLNECRALEIDTSDIDDTMRELSQLKDDFDSYNPKGLEDVLEFCRICEKTSKAKDDIQIRKSDIEQKTIQFNAIVERYKVPQREEYYLNGDLVIDHDKDILDHRVTIEEKEHRDKYGVHFKLQSNGRYENQVVIDAMKNGTQTPANNDVLPFLGSSI